MILRRRVRSELDLQDAINAYNPTDVYHSVALWRNPEDVHGVGSRGFMGCPEYPLDIDAHEGNLKDAAQIALKLSSEFSGTSEIAFTGRGFRILLEGYRGCSMTEDAKTRQKLLGQLQEFTIINGFRQMPVDVGTLTDQFRVIRTIGTTNSKPPNLYRCLTCGALNW